MVNSEEVGGFFFLHQVAAFLLHDEWHNKDTQNLQIWFWSFKSSAEQVWPPARGHDGFEEMVQP